MSDFESIEMAGPTTQSVSDDLKGLTKDFSAYQTEFAAFRGQVNVHLAYIKWVGVFFSGILVALISGTAGFAWNASALNSEVKQQGVRTGNIEAVVQRQGVRIENINGEIQKQGSRIESIEVEVRRQGTRIENIDAEVRQLGTRLEKIEKNSESILQHLEQIGRRLDSAKPRSNPDQPLPQ